MAVPFKVKAGFEYKSDEAGDLNFGVGQIITVTDDEDADWYTGEYADGTGQKLEGMFPRNFVEKYEPAIPSRPNRGARKSVNTVPAAESLVQSNPDPIPVAQPAEAQSPEPPEVPQSTVVEEPVQRKTSTTSNSRMETKPAPSKQPPAVAEKPNSSSFKDRIAAFNKPAAAPIAPFKPPGGAGSSGFIKKPFVAPPPSRNAYVPPPSQAPPPHIAYRREEDPEMQNDEEEDVSVEKASRGTEADAGDQPKPTSLKDRIALLQQQQLEQAARLADKKKPKKPPTKRTESADTLENATVESTGAPISRRGTGDTLGRASLDATRIDEDDSLDASEPSKAEPLVTTPIPPPSRELVSDTNDADDSEAADNEDIRDVSEDEEEIPSKPVQSPSHAATEQVAHDEDPQEQEDTEDEDPEVRRRRELRDRMAKMSGGMGMMGMFGPSPGASAPPRKTKAAKESETSAQVEQQDDMPRAPPVPIMALPGMGAGAPRQQESNSDEEADDDTAAPTPMEGKRQVDKDDYISQPVRRSTDRELPRSPPDRSVPPVPGAVPSIPQTSQSSSARAMPPQPPRVVNQQPEIDQDEPTAAPAVPSRTSIDRRSSTRTSMPPGVPPNPPGRPSLDGSVPNPSTTSTSDKRASRPPPPPVPGSVPTSPSSRAPPPPPPAQPPSRSSTGASLGLATSELPDDGSDEEVTEYEGDYDTDIASSAKHKEALKSHNRDSSIEDEDTLTDDVKLPASPPTRAVPPPPPSAPPREIPPLPPTSNSKSKRSSEIPRGAPPPVPTTRPDDDDYDPYRYSMSQQNSTAPPSSPPLLPPVRSSTQNTEDSDLYGPSITAPTARAPPPPPSGVVPPPPTERVAPLPPPPTEQPTGLAEPAWAPSTRRSVEISRKSTDYGFIASDIDLAESSGWWVNENTVPPSLQGRNDILYEVESNTSSKRGGRTTVTRDIYILYIDYSQSSINVAFDPSDPSHASFQQSHQRPPPPSRQDQLESAFEQYGRNIANAAQSMSGNTVADGSAHSFVMELLTPYRSTALMPVGTRSYGALVYANLANASTQQFDEIRSGDIVTFRNAKFAGHKGGLHAKYSMEVGKPDHVGVVIDWDGTKKKIRAWEQGRDEKGKKTKVREESFRIGDLKSGEVRVWRVMPRSWVNWDKS